MPTQDTRAAQFVNATRRGTAARDIGIVDTGISLDHPSLTTTSTGQPKVIDWVTGTDPFDRRRSDLAEHGSRGLGPTFAFGGVRSRRRPRGTPHRRVQRGDPRFGGEVAGNRREPRR